jgi:hypothetical protein
MNAPLKGRLSPAALETIRQHAASGTTSSAAQVLGVLAGEPIPHGLAAAYFEARDAAKRLGELAVLMVEGRDETAFVDLAVEAAPRPANDDEIEPCASEQLCAATQRANEPATAVRLRLRGADSEAMEAIRERVVATTGLTCVVEEREDVTP